MLKQVPIAFFTPWCAEDLASCDTVSTIFMARTKASPALENVACQNACLMKSQYKTKHASLQAFPKLYKSGCTIEMPDLKLLMDPSINRASMRLR